MTVFKHSRLVRANLYIDEQKDVAFLDNTHRYINEHPDDTLYRWMEGDRLDLIAIEAYGNAQLKHLILLANPNIPSEFLIRAGDVVRIPFKERRDLAWAF
jgi:hypothetical protein